MSSEAKHLASLSTNLPPDAIAALPSTPDEKLAVIGTYQLQQHTSQRDGALEVVCASRIGDEYTLRTLYVHGDMPGVLDVRTEDDFVVAACAQDQLLTLRMGEKLSNVGRLRYDDENDDRLIYSTDLLRQGSDLHVASCDSTGGVALHKLDNENEHLSRREASAHAEQVWTVCIDPEHKEVLYSGGDDGVLRASSPECELWRMRKSHGGVGVTSVMRRGSELWTGGYDDVVRVWDLRMRKCLREVEVGGGVWRMRGEGRVLVAAMYGGVKVLDDALEVVAEYGGHESIVYGAEWLWEGIGVTASFYDRAVRLWEVR